MLPLCSLDEWVKMLQSTVMTCQRKLSNDDSLSSSDGDTVAYMLVWLLCIVFLRDTDHTSEVRRSLCYSVVGGATKGLRTGLGPMSLCITWFSM